MILSSVEEVAGAPGARVGRITFDRPEKKNALTPAMLARLVGMVESLCAGGEGGGGGVGAVVLEGHGAAFCAGFDLTLCREDARVLGELLDGLSRAVRALRRCPVPVVAAAHGAAIAGGAALLGGADVVVTHHDARIGYPVVRLGISPAVSAPFMIQGVGAGRVRERMLDTALMSGWEALRIGLAHECIEDAGKVRARAMAIAAGLAAKPRPGMAATKRLLNELDGSLDDARADAALGASLALVGSAEERERLAAMWKW